MPMEAKRFAEHNQNIISHHAYVLLVATTRSLKEKRSWAVRSQGIDTSRQAKLRTATMFRTSTSMTMASSILTSLMSTMTIRLVP